jgi:tetratricopeptide (TPR) repeat protein
MSLMLHHLGDNEDALDYGQQALTAAQKIGVKPEQALALTHMGHALAELNRLDEAREAYQKAADLRLSLHQYNLAAEPLAGLARVNVALGEPAQAERFVEQIMEHLESDTLDGTEEPCRVYLTCFEVLKVNRDPRAMDVLSFGYQQLQDRAKRIHDEHLRQSYLEEMPAHHALVQAWQANQN